VLVRRTVAAEGGAALLASPQVHPGGADLHALFAFVTLGKADRFNGFEM
jgi:hypothetical protein